MRPHELTKMRELLLQRRAEVLAEGTVPVEFEKGEVVAKPDEDAAPLAEMTQVIASNRNRSRTAALQATLCAECQKEDEQANSARGRSRRHLTDYR